MSEVQHEERHASWLELFFDLVVVAGIGTLAHLLERDQSGDGFAVYLLAFTAFWIVWACYTTYANLAGEGTRTVQMLLGMAVLGVMMAAVPEIRDEHARAFAVAYVVGRVAAARPWRQATVVVDLPVVQAIVGVVPWIVSWWFDGTTRSVLWAVGLAIDLGLLLTTTREKLIAESQGRLDAVLARLADTGSRGTDSGTADGHPVDDAPRAVGRARGGPRRARPGRPVQDVPTRVVALDADPAHLAERMGLFVLIVLGEGLIQTIEAAGEATWDRHLAATGAGAFALVFSLWGLAVHHGYAGVALLDPGALSPRLSWAAHLCSTGALATVVAVLGGFVAEPHEAVADHDRFLVSAAFAVFALLAVGVHVRLGRRATGVARRVSLLRAVRVGVPMLGAALVVLLVPRLVAQGAVWVLAGGALVAAALGIARPSRPPV